MKEKDIWRKGLKVLQQLGLDKAAFAADKKCQPCQMQKTVRYVRMIYEQLEIISSLERS